MIIKRQRRGGTSEIYCDCSLGAICLFSRARYLLISLFLFSNPACFLGKLVGKKIEDSHRRLGVHTLGSGAENRLLSFVSPKYSSSALIRRWFRGQIPKRRVDPREILPVVSMVKPVLRNPGAHDAGASCARQDNKDEVEIALLAAA